VKDVNELRERLVEVWAVLQQNVIDDAIDQWRRRLRACVWARGGHFMAARQLAGRRPLYFTADVSILLLTSFFYSSPNLGGFWADRHQTLPHVRR